MSLRDPSRSRVANWRRSYYGKRFLTHYGYRKWAEASQKREFYMVPRDMRKYWGDQNKPLYGPTSSYSNYLRYFVNGPYHRGRNRR